MSDTKAQILALIRAGIASDGYPPTVRELMDSAGLKSPSSVQHHLAALERDGVISRDGVKARAITLNGEPE